MGLFVYLSIFSLLGDSVKFWGTKVPCTVHYGDFILRVLECIETNSFGFSLYCSSSTSSSSTSSSSSSTSSSSSSSIRTTDTECKLNCSK